MRIFVIVSLNTAVLHLLSVVAAYLHIINRNYCSNYRDFTSAHTIRVESGISHVMEQYDRNFKVQQLMGAKTDILSPSSNKQKKK